MLVPKNPLYPNDELRERIERLNEHLRKVRRDELVAAHAPTNMELEYAVLRRNVGLEPKGDE